jgi:hypothetical protein
VPTFVLPRFLEAHAERKRHAEILARVVREAQAEGKQADVARERKRFAPTAVDSDALRGLPCVGPGCGAGAIRFTNPEAETVARLSR